MSPNHEGIDVNMKMFSIAAVALALTAAPVWAEEAATAEPAGKPVIEFKDNLDRYSYTFGVNLGSQFKKQGVELNLDMLKQGWMDAVAGTGLALTQDEMREAMMEMQRQMMEKLQKAAEANASESARFLAENATKEGVKALESGLQYKVLKEGTGRTPSETDTVRVHYRGTLIDGKQFDSSYDRGEPFQTKVKGGIIPGWTEALLHMKEGDKWQVFIPSNLAYGERGQGIIPPNAALIFEMELVEIVDAAAPQALGSS